MTTSEDMEGVMQKLQEDDRDIVALMKLPPSTTPLPLTRELMATYRAAWIRQSIDKGNLIVRESFSSKEGQRFVC